MLRNSTINVSPHLDRADLEHSESAPLRHGFRHLAFLVRRVLEKWVASRYSSYIRLWEALLRYFGGRNCVNLY